MTKSIRIKNSKFTTMKEIFEFILFDKEVLHLRSPQSKSKIENEMCENKIEYNMLVKKLKECKNMIMVTNLNIGGFTYSHINHNNNKKLLIFLMNMREQQ